jgi:hypothetical protein
MGWFDQQAQQMPQQGGSLAALGGGTGRNAPIYNPVQPPQSGPQPVPGMPPRQMPDWPQFQTPPTLGGPPELSFDSLMKNGAPSWMQGDPSQHSDQGGWGGNRGSGQPINQPMATSQPLPWDGSGGQSSMGGSLQSLGGGMNQSGMVNLRGPDGSTKAVAQNDLAHWLSKGAVRV